jgi:EmrB/QacA subfamily drug resistance transporter
MRNTQENFDHLPGYKTRWWGLLFIGISLMVISLDNTILNVAIPSISRDLGASASELQWIIDAYILVFASLLLTMGALGDRYGRKRILQFGLVMFGLGSLAAGLATTTNMLIASRAFLGIGGAVIMPSTLSLISATFPPHERPQAFALWAAVFGLGVGVGPIVGGWLLKYYEWNSVFFINLPVVVVALAGGAFTLGESKDEHAQKIDIPGVLLSITGLVALVYGIIEAGVVGWTDPKVLLAFGAGFVLLVAFAWWENRNPDAMLPMHFFKNMSFTGANVAMVMVMFAMFGSIFFMSQYFQSVLGYSALESGIRLLPLALTMMVMSASSARITEKLGTKIAVALGISIAATGLLLMSRFYTIDTPYSTIVPIIIVFASGMGLTFSPATNSIMQSVPVNKAGIGSAMNDTTRQLGGALGVAVLGTLMNRVYLENIASLQSLTEQYPIPQESFDQLYEVVSSSIQGAHIVVANAPAMMPEAMKETILTTANSAFVMGMTEAMTIGAFIMFGAALFALVVLPAQVQRPKEGDSSVKVAADNIAIRPASGD